MSDRPRDPDSARPTGLPRARRVVPAAWELDAPTLDASPPVLPAPSRPLASRAHDGDTDARRRPCYDEYDEEDDKYDRPRRRPRPPSGPDALAVVAVSAGGVAALAACLWPIGLTAGVVAVACGAAALRGRSRRLAVAGLTLGVVVVVVVVSSGLGAIVLTALAGASHPAPAAPAVPPFFPTAP